MTDRAALGRIGEDLAVRHLCRVGMVVVARNWRSAAGDVRGEVDVVAWDGPVLVFCEVKTRRGLAAGGPLAAVDGRKRARLRALAALYLSQERPRTRDVRFDVVGVVWDGPAAWPRVEHVRGVDG